jgi:hypothetical protein
VRDDAAMAFSRVARAVRMTGLLQAKLIRDMDEALARAAAAKSPEELIDEASEEAMRLDPEGHMRKFRVERIFERVAKAECGKDEDRIDRLCIEAGERLDDEDLYGDLLERPVGELVALLCRDLGLDPDWSRLAEEAWAREEITSGTWPPSPSRGSLRSYTNVEDGRVGVNTPGLQDKELEAVDLEREPSRLQRPPFDDSEHTPIPAFPPRGGRSGAHPP